ncbi:hypothetical protein BCR43DRAFT_496377 [Syncephalastrum racemosum]|uniref:Crossover junction endonuclease MUS81 n=1 Tax=Syncephalastrum racemosum TaxID=13706 RepID=A0A1X2H3Z1_SYNRA|nr:hypothetical protein BCR43DRAFT_496377 [Syncephalastrum racemosum]
MPASQCANPLWRDWIKEWMEEARAIQSKAYFTYKKAYDSMDQCTIQFSHPCETQQLKGIGPGMVSRLENRLRKHCTQNNLPLPERPRGEKRDRPDSGGDESRRTRRKTTKPYVPGYRTGAYGILRALLQLRELYDQQYATKEEIIRHAQDHCDSSFDTPEPGKSYTAWSGIKTLEKKEYIWKQGSPAKYMLTDTGLYIAENLQSTANGEPARPLPSSGNTQEEPEWNDTQEEEEVDLSLYVLNPERFRASSSVSSSSNPNPFATTTTTTSTPLAPAPAPAPAPTTPSRAASSILPAAVTQPIEIADDDEEEEEDLSLYFLEPEKHTANNRTKNVTKTPSYASASHIRHPTPTTQDDIDTILSQSSQPAEMIWEGPPPSNEPDTPFPFTYLDTHGNPVKHMAQANVQIKDQKLTYHIRFEASVRSTALRYGVIDLRYDDRARCTGFLPEEHSVPVAGGVPPQPVLPLFSSQDSSSQSHPWPNLTLSSSQPLSQSEFTAFPPDSYEIVLVLDTREIKNRSDRDYFQEQLTAKGVKVVKRALELGDVIWVAQKKGSTSQGDALFLDIVLERKRMDDLVTSIKDGRFLEQKHRLSNAAARKVFYVVEEYNKEAAVQFGAQAVQTSMLSTQITDQFFLKRTLTVDDTIDFLVKATRMVERMYEGVTLHRIPEHTVSRHTYVDLKQQLGSAHVISYPLYNRLNSKTGSMPLKDLYHRMLMVLRGVSAEKATALVKRYPTPRSLLDAYQTMNEHQGQLLAKEATQEHISRRRWGLALSKKLYDVWGS